MNVNTIMTAQSLTNYVNNTNKCDNTNWLYKFNNAWQSCWYWSSFNASVGVAKSYIFDVNYLPKGSALSFPIPVRSYQPQLFSSYVVNTTVRPVNNTDGYIVGQKFVVGNSLTNTVLTFIADPNIKLSLNNALSFYGQTWLGIPSTAIFKLTSTVNATRTINPNYDVIMKFYSSATVNRTILPTIKTVFSGNSTIFANRYIIWLKPTVISFWAPLNTWENCQIWETCCQVCTNQTPILLFKGSIYIQPNCSVSWWIRKMYTWKDCQIWS